MSKNIAKNIRMRLAELDKNFEYLAEKLEVTSASIRTTVSNLEDGKSIRTDTLEKIANALGVDIKSLFD